MRIGIPPFFFAGLYLVPRRSCRLLLNGLSVFLLWPYDLIFFSELKNYLGNKEKIKTKLSVGVSTRWWCSTKLFACWSCIKILVLRGNSDLLLKFQMSLPLASLIMRFGKRTCFCPCWRVYPVCVQHNGHSEKWGRKICSFYHIETWQILAY